MRIDLYKNKPIDDVAVDLIKEYQPLYMPYYGGFSGGIDSQIIYNLSLTAKASIEWYYNESPIDPKQTRNFIKTNYPDVIFSNNAEGFWKYEFLANGMPLRTQRWCCRIIKESGGIGRIKLLGMRKAESPNRSDYFPFMDATWQGKGTKWLLPIIDWTNNDRKEYLHKYNIRTNPIYDLGFSRTGCVLCPNQTKKEVELSLIHFSHITETYKRFCNQYIKLRWELWNKYGDKDKRRRKPTFLTGEEYFNWCISR